MSVAFVALPVMAFAFRHGERVRDGGWRILALLMFIIFWGAVIALAVWAFSRIIGSRKTEKGLTQRSPMDIAKERLAKGEISAEEFERIKQQLI
jgi:putative membrane protein